MLRNNEPETQDPNYNVFDYRLIDDSSNSQLASQLLCWLRDTITCLYIMCWQPPLPPLLPTRLLTSRRLWRGRGFYIVYTVCHICDTYESAPSQLDTERPYSHTTNTFLRVRINVGKIKRVEPSVILSITLCWSAQCICYRVALRNI